VPERGVTEDGRAGARGAGARGPGSWLAGFGLLAVALIALPHLLSFSQQEIAVFLVINVLLVVSYRLLTLTGEWSLGHVVIMGVGGYASAIYSKALGVPVPLAMLAGATTAAAVAFLLAFPLFRMKGFYFLIGSFAAGEVIRLLWKRFRVPFGGPKGLKLIPSVPNLELGPITIDFFEPVWRAWLGKCGPPGREGAAARGRGTNGPPRNRGGCILPQK